ncbi:MAG: glycosyl hydrolase family 18 protein [Lachnospiraceae bacterium]
MLIYTVKAGDTVDSIATAYGIPVSTVLYNNQISYPYSLAIGQSLLLSVETEILPEKRAIYTGGYAYPFIDREVLNETLPYLSYLYVFSYGFTPEGSLVPPLLDDTFMITQANAYGSSPVLTLTPLGPDGLFNNNLITQIVNNLDARRRLKDEIVVQITERGFEGLDIDFEYILATDREAFVDFVAYMQQSISALGYPVSVALAPKTSDTQVGLLYEGKDYARLGEVADYVLLMTYEWGYTYGPPMAVAPLNKVREVVEYALTVIPAEKIHLGVPNYGYDWALPFIRGESKATSIGNIEAVQIAIAHGVPILFDDVALSPYFYYEGVAADGFTPVRHEVWFEDARSINEKLNLVEQYGLRGFSCWQIMRLFRAMWMLTADRFYIQ